MAASSADASNLLMLHLLGRCNLECLHCYMDGSPRRAELLSRDRVLQAIADCKDLGVEPALPQPLSASSNYGACGTARLPPAGLPALSNVRLPIATP